MPWQQVTQLQGLQLGHAVDLLVHAVPVVGPARPQAALGLPSLGQVAGGEAAACGAWSRC